MLYALDTEGHQRSGRMATLFHVSHGPPRPSVSSLSLRRWPVERDPGTLFSPPLQRRDASASEPPGETCDPDACYKLDRPAGGLPIVLNTDRAGRPISSCRLPCSSLISPRVSFRFRANASAHKTPKQEAQGPKGEKQTPERRDPSLITPPLPSKEGWWPDWVW